MDLAHRSKFATFLDLPNEILPSILNQITNKDVDTLFAIKSLRNKMSQLFCLITDIHPSTHFPNIPNAKKLDEFVKLPSTHFGLSGFLSIILEVNDVGRHVFTIHRLSKKVDTRISVFDFKVFDSLSNFNRDDSRINLISFENVRGLKLSNEAFDPSVFCFPKLKTFKLDNCGLFGHNSKFLIPKVEELEIEGAFSTINSSIDYINSNLHNLLLTEIEDTGYWENVENYSIKNIIINKSPGLVIYRNLIFHSLTELSIDADIREFSNIYCPKLKKLRLEQFMHATISIFNVNLPCLETLELWIAKIDEFHDISMPKINSASIMLSNEPIPDNQSSIIDLSCFKGLEKIQLCFALEILKFINALKHLEIRGPLINPLLYELEFNHLNHFEMYFNNTSTELPIIKAPNLKSLQLSRCMNIRELRSSKLFPYPNLESFSIQYSAISKIDSLNLPKLKEFKYIASAWHPLEIKNSEFPLLKSFHATNLDILSDKKSMFDFIAPSLEVLFISNFNVDNYLISNSNFPKLINLSLIGGFQDLTLDNCENLEILDISKNQFKNLIISDGLQKLASLQCEGTNILDFEFETPLLKRVVYDEMISYVKK